MSEELVKELKDRCSVLLKTRGVKHPNGFVKLQIKDVNIELSPKNGLYVELWESGWPDSIPVYHEGVSSQLNSTRFLREDVLPVLRAAMILEDIAGVRSSEEDA